MTAIDTTRVTGRRTLHFTTFADIRADVETLASAARIRTLGNWPPGTILAHLAEVMRGSLDGLKIEAPLLIRLLARYVFKRKFLTQPMKPGLQLPEKAARVLIPAKEVSWEEGLSLIRTALDRLAKEDKRAPSPVLGPLSNSEWEQLHCRHSELHLSFLIPE